MGWRALRLALERDALMKAQARALLEAAGGPHAHVMFPMVSEPWEYEEARALFEKQRAWLAGRGKTVAGAVRYGAMLEVPALAEVLDHLLPQARFPVDRHQRPDPVPVRRRSRQSPARRTLRLAEPRDPALPRRASRTHARRRGVPVGVCGEMGGRPLEAMALLGLGIDRLSITPAAIGPVKAMIRSLDVGALRAALPGMARRGAARPARADGRLGGGARRRAALTPDDAFDHACVRARPNASFAKPRPAAI